MSNRFGLEAEPTRWLVPPPYSDSQWFAVYGVSILVWLFSFYVLGLYHRRRFSPGWAVVAVSLGSALILTLVFFFKDYNFSRLAAGAAWFFNVLLLAGWRLCARWLAHKRGAGDRRERILLVGVDREAVRFVEYWEKVGHAECDLIGIVRQEGDAVETVVAGRPVVGETEELAQLLRDYDIDALVFVPSTLALALEHMDQRWGVEGLRVCMVPISFAELTSADHIGKRRLPLIEILPST
jgi:FlaA1/EpsC-like NDP-sugar epimerase